MTLLSPAIMAALAAPLLSIAAMGAAMGAAPSAAGASTQQESDGLVPPSTSQSINAPYNAFLEKYVVAKNGINHVRYGDVTAADKAALQAYVTALSALKPSTMTQSEQIAYYANLYNAHTVVVILDHYPVTSIRRIGGGLLPLGPWDDPAVTVEGKELTLNNIEHDIVRAQFAEPRVHYAFNCASIGCPDLRPTAWEAASLDADLDAAARAYIAHPRGVQVDTRGRVVASSIYKWFKEDFGDNDAEILDHIRQYAVGEKANALKAATKIHRYDYDWSLNDL